ncbi:unnamed protein product [Allacma fusca]|uniref:Retinol dehydrogenase 12 n=1 Tax=Allacma fusca TaxID=39272 RepID=A0A8J2IYK7_9HEXA|nr:unnamed protein product [Allacma fusca]
MSIFDYVFIAPIKLYERWLCSIGNRYKNLDDRSGEEDVMDKIVVITGASAGLGKCVALEMAKRGAVVVMCCRDLPKANTVVTEIQGIVPDAKLYVIHLDVSDMDSVRTCAKEIVQKFNCIHILINNAGIATSHTKPERTSAGYEKHLATNHLGHMLFTMLLLGHLRLGAPSRVVCVGSLLYAFSKLPVDDLNWEKPRTTRFVSLGPYSDSKRWCMLFAKELGRRLDGTGITTYSLCPGLSRTGITSNFSWFKKIMVFIVIFYVGCTVSQGAGTILYCALAEELAQQTGQAYHFKRIWTRANRELLSEDAVKLWKDSEKLLGLSFDKYFPAISQHKMSGHSTVRMSSMESQD